MSEKNRFKKVMSAADIFVVAFGAMIGWGWVVSSGSWIQRAGIVGSILGFVIGGIMLYFVGLTYAELTPAMPLAGGEHVFSYKALGANGSFICTWSLILSYVGVVCYEACSLPTIIQYIFPGFVKGYLYTIAGFDVYFSWILLSIVVTILITYVNIRGIKSAAILQAILTIVIAAAGILLVASSVWKGDSENLNSQLLIGNDGFNIIRNIMSVAVVAPFFLLGFDVIPQVAEEINIPLKKIGQTLLISIICAVTFYTLILFSIGYGMNAKEISDSLQSSGLVAADAMAKLFNSAAMAKVLILGGLCGIATSWNSFFIGGSRAIFSMAEAYMIPHTFSELHPVHKTPVNALLLIGFLSLCAPFFGRNALVWIADAASFGGCTAYCIVAISFLIIRKKYPDLHRPYRVVHYKLIGTIAVAMSSLMIIMFVVPGSGCTLSSQEWIIVGGWTALGIIFYIVSKKRYGKKFGTVEA